MPMYSKDITIWSTDVALNRKLRPSVLFKMAQEAAIIHVSELGIGKDITLDRGLLWVIVRQEAVINELPSYGDSITITSWPGTMIHSLFPRITRLTGNSGAVLAEVSSLWTLMDINTRQMINPEQEGIIVLGESSAPSVSFPSPIKRMNTDKSVEYTVPYSYSDLNGHLSNIHYLDIAEDIISDFALSHTPKRITAEYNSEIKFGHSVTISYGCSDDNKYYFTGDSDRHKFSLLFEY